MHAHADKARSPGTGCAHAPPLPEKSAGKKRPPAADALLSLDSARRRVYIFWIHFF